MSHEIDLVSREDLNGSMAYTGELPWHGLGQKLSEDSPIEVWADQAGMDWKLLSTPAMGLNPITDTAFAFPQRNILFRSDTGAPLSIVSDAYQIVQPMQVLEFYRDLIADNGFKLHTAGVLFGGKKFWALAELGESTRIMGQDKIDGYLLLATSCDASLATTAQFTSVRVVCNNTLSFSVGQEQGKIGTIKVSHNAQFDPQEVKNQLGVSKEAFETFTANVNKMAQRKVTDREAIDWLVKVVNNLPDDTELTDDQLELSDAKTVKTMFELYKGGGKGSNLKSSEGTLWGVVNSVTEFTDHHRKTKTQDNRLNSAWFGQSATLKNRAYSEALKLVA